MSRRRGEGSIRKQHCKCAKCRAGCKASCLHNTYWRALWYCTGCDKHPVRGQHSAQFRHEVEARTHLREQLVAKSAGRLQVTLGLHTFRQLAEAWLEVKKGRKEKTVVGYESILDNWLLPKWAGRRVETITVLEVDQFVAGIDREANTVRNIYRVLRQVMAYGVKIGWLEKNPCAAELPRRSEGAEGGGPCVLTPEELESVAKAAGSGDGAGTGPKWEALIRFLGWTGLRSGEASALRVRDVNPLKGTVTVRRSVGKVKGKFVEGATKTYQERTIRVIPAALDPVLELIEGRGPDELVFTNGHLELGGANYLTAGQIHGALRKAAKAVLPVEKHAIRVHDLRHTHASILIVWLGQDVVTVQKRLGHKDAAITLKVYSHWFPQQEDDLVDAMEQLASEVAAVA